MSARYRASEEHFRKLNELLPSLVLVGQAPRGRRHRLSQRGGEGAGCRARPRAAPCPTCSTRKRWPGSATTATSLRSAEVAMRGADGEMFWTIAWIAPIEFDDAAMWLVVASDIRTAPPDRTPQLPGQPRLLTRLLNRREFEAQVRGFRSPRAAMARCCSSTSTSSS